MNLADECFGYESPAMRANFLAQPAKSSDKCLRGPVSCRRPNRWNEFRAYHGPNGAGYNPNNPQDISAAGYRAHADRRKTHRQLCNQRVLNRRKDVDIDMVSSIGINNGSTVPEVCVYHKLAQ